MNSPSAVSIGPILSSALGQYGSRIAPVSPTYVRHHLRRSAAASKSCFAEPTRSETSSSPEPTATRSCTVSHRDSSRRGRSNSTRSAGRWGASRSHSRDSCRNSWRRDRSRNTGDRRRARVEPAAVKSAATAMKSPPVMSGIGHLWVNDSGSKKQYRRDTPESPSGGLPGTVISGLIHRPILPKPRRPAVKQPRAAFAQCWVPLCAPPPSVGPMIAGRNYKL